MLYTHLQHHNDTIIKTQWQRRTQEGRRRKTSLTIFTSHFIARVRKGCVGFYCERELEIEQNCNILTPHSYGRHVVSFLFSWCSTGGQRGSLCWVICYILSVTSQVPKLHRGSRGPPGPGVAFPTPSRLQLSRTLQATRLPPPGRRTQLEPEFNSTGSSNSTELYNRSTPTRSLKSNVQAEITVMQFTCHSLPVHQSVVYHGNFFSSSHFISQFPPTRFPLITAIRMCHFLPVHHLEWHFWPGQKVKT